MNTYTYLWSLRPQTGFALEVRVSAPSAVVARREVRRFLVDHGGGSWTVESVSREAALVPHELLTLPAAGRGVSAQ